MFMNVLHKPHRNCLYECGQSAVSKPQTRRSARVRSPNPTAGSCWAFAKLTTAQSAVHCIWRPRRTGEMKPGHPAISEKTFCQICSIYNHNDKVKSRIADRCCRLVNYRLNDFLVSGKQLDLYVSAKDSTLKSSLSAALSWNEIFTRTFTFTIVRT